MKYIVTRPFRSSVPHAKGETVDLDGLHVQKLLDQRFIAPVGSEAAKAAQADVKAEAVSEPVPAAPEPVKAAEPAPVKKKRGRPPKAKPVADAAPTVTLN